MGHLFKVTVSVAGIFMTFICLSNAQQVKRSTNERLLCSVTKSEIVNNTFTFSPNMRSIAFRIKVSNKEAVVIDGKQGNSFDAVGAPVFSPDGKRYAYSARNDHEWFIVENDKVTAVEASSVITAIFFSPDSKEIAYILNDGHKYRLIRGGKAGNSYDYINDNSITFSSDSRKIAYSVRNNEKSFIVMNGTECTLYDEVGFPVLSKDGRHFAYWAVGDKKVYAVIDNQESRAYESVDDIIFNKDGSRYAYHATYEGKHVIVMNGEESEPYQFAHSLCFSPDGSRNAYAAETKEGDHEGFHQFVVLDGKKLPMYETIIENSIEFSHDSKGIAYKAEKHDEFFMVVNGKEGKYYSDVLQVTSAFSHDNSRFAYVAESNSMRLVNSDGKESETYNDIYCIAFSPGQQAMAYAARNSNREFVVIDGIPGKEYEAILGQGEIVFDSGNLLHYMALRGDNIYLVEETLSR